MLLLYTNKSTLLLQEDLKKTLKNYELETIIQAVGELMSIKLPVAEVDTIQLQLENI